MPSERDADPGPELGPEPDSGRDRREVVLAGHTGNVQVARSALGHPDGAMRLAALGALARAGALSTDELLASMHDPDPGVRRRAAELAAAYPESAANVALLGLLDDAETLVAEMAAWALGERAPTSVVVSALSRVAREHEDPLCREAAVAALGALADPAGLPAILEATTDKPAIRRRAVIALAPFEGDEVDAALLRARSDRDWQVRQAAEDQEGRQI